MTPTSSGPLPTVLKFILIILEPCVCDLIAVVLEPVGGGGSFDVRSGLYFDEHLVNEIDRPIVTGDVTYIGIELFGITNPNMVVTVERLWATPTADPDDPNQLLLLSKDVTGCATVNPILGEYPQPNGYDEEEPDGHPHLAFEINAKALTAGFDETFIHFNTKVCVTNAQNCFGTCNEMAGNDDSFVGLPEQPRRVEYNNSDTSRSYLVYKEQERSTGFTLKRFWDKVIEFNKEKIDAKVQDPTLGRESWGHNSSYMKEYNSSTEAHERLTKDPEYIARLNNFISSRGNGARDGDIRVPYADLVSHQRERRSGEYKLGLNQAKVLTNFLDTAGPGPKISSLF